MILINFIQPPLKLGEDITSFFSGDGEQAGLEGSDVKEHAEEMRGASSEDKKVPDGMLIGKFFPGIKNCSQGVGKPSNQKPKKETFGACPYQWLSRNNNQPPHRQVGKDGQNSESVHGKNIDQDAHDCHAPNQPEEGPPPRPAQCHKGDRGVAARNHKVNTAVIKKL